MRGAAGVCVSDGVDTTGVVEGMPIPIRKKKFPITFQKYVPTSWLNY